MSDELDRLINVKELARKCGVGTATVYRMTADGRLPQPLRLGPSCVRWSLAEVEAAISGLPRVVYAAPAQPSPPVEMKPRRGRKPISFG